MMVYVLPTEEGLPPRALLVPGLFQPPIAARWSEELDTWTIDDIEVDDDLSNVITQHALTLGVVFPGEEKET